MAIKIYGSCGGNYGDKYNLWFEVTENSHSIVSNSSNITIKLKLKRNDGYNSTAYNLNENENNAKITINGVNKINRNLAIDTRNCATLLLAEWSGDVAHNADGTLLLKVEGSFTMDGTTLPGGSVSGDFRCVDIPRVSSFDLDKKSVAPSEEFTVTISTASNLFSHEIVCVFDTFEIKTTLSPGEKTATLTLPEEWATSLPYSTHGIVVVALKTYNSSTYIGSKSKQIKYMIPETNNFLPVFNLSSTRVNRGGMPGNWDACLQNFSTLTVKISNAHSFYSAEIIKGEITVDGVTKQGMEADFPIHNSGIINITATVTDSRGFKKSESIIEFVDEYFKPTVEFTSLFRCDSYGAPLSNGKYACVDFKEHFSSVRDLNFTRVYLCYKKSGTSDYSEPVLISRTPCVINGDFEITSSYDFLLKITDAVTSTPFEVQRSLPTGSVAFNIKKGGKGAGFGCYAENDNELTIGYDLNLKGKLKFKDIGANIVIGSGFTKYDLTVKDYECLDFVYLRGRFYVSSSVPANTWITLLIVGEKAPSINLPASVATGNYNIDKDLKAFINTNGEVKICSASQINTGTEIFVNGIY